MRAPGHLSIRVPDFAPAGAVRMSRNGTPVRLEPRDGFVTVTDCLPGQVIEMSYPLPHVTEQVMIGNLGRHQYRFTATWKGDTVVRMIPAPDNPATGWSDFDKSEIPLFYGEEGPARLYRRDHMIADGEPTLSQLHEEGGGPDFWSL